MREIPAHVRFKKKTNLTKMTSSMIRDRTTKFLEQLVHPYKTMILKRKQQRAQFYENLENYDEERINQRALLLKKLRAKFYERRGEQSSGRERRKERARSGSSSSRVRRDDDEEKIEAEKDRDDDADDGNDVVDEDEMDVPTLSESAIEKLVEDLRNGKDMFSMTDAMSIITGCTMLFSGEPIVSRVNASETDDGFVIIVGDLHGQLEDLLHLLKLCGMPSENNVYVFNGDLVDRGGNGCEVVLLILAMKLMHPKFVHINRGNHEDPHINIFGGFEEECLKKYDHGIFQAFHECFRWFPICTIVNDSVFVCHGGPPMENGEAVSVKRLEKISKVSFFESKEKRRMSKREKKKSMMLKNNNNKKEPIVRKSKSESEFSSKGVAVAAAIGKLSLREKEGIYEAESEVVEEDEDDSDGEDADLSDDEYEAQIERDYLICKSMIWSDPHPSDDFIGIEDSTRGAGGLYGSNITKQFLEENELSCILRSHQCVASGIETCHDGKLFTVFSASNYCGKSGNRGAVLRLKRSDKQPQPKFALTWKYEDCLDIDLRHKVLFKRKKGDKKRALSLAAIQASEYIIEYKRELFDHWRSLDIKGKGRVTREQWADGLQTVLKLRSQWKKMFPILVDASEVVTGGIFSRKAKNVDLVNTLSSKRTFKKVYVKFPEFLARYTPKLKSGCRQWQVEVLNELRQALISEAKHLTSAFERMDIDGSGSIDSKEFMKAVRDIHSLDILSNAQIMAVFNAFDVDDSGSLDLDEFTNMFEQFVSEENNNDFLDPASPTSPNKNREDRVSVLWKDRSSKRREQVVRMISLARSLSRKKEEEENDKVKHTTTTTTTTSTANKKETSTKSALKKDNDEEIKISDMWNDEIEQAIVKLFCGYQKELHHLWHTIVSAKGSVKTLSYRQSIKLTDFIDLILSLDEVTNGDMNVLTESSAKKLAEHMDTNKDGTIDFDEFIRATAPDIDLLNRYLKFDNELG